MEGQRRGLGLALVLDGRYVTPEERAAAAWRSDAGAWRRGALRRLIARVCGIFSPTLGHMRNRSPRPCRGPNNTIVCFLQSYFVTRGRVQTRGMLLNPLQGRGLRLRVCA